MQMDAMSFDTVDVKAMVIRQINYAEASRRWPIGMAAVKQLVSAQLSFRIGPRLAAWGGGLIAKWIGRRTQWVDDKTVQLEGLAQRLRKSVAEAAIYPADPDLLNKIDEFLTEVAEVQQGICPAANKLLQVNSGSRVAAAILKLSRSFDAMAAAATLLRQIATGNDWETDVGVQQTRFKYLRERIRSRETLDMDAELLAMAEETTEARRHSDCAFDDAWARGLAAPMKRD
jgi:hypothetical protein